MKISVNMFGASFGRIERCPLCGQDETLMYVRGKMGLFREARGGEAAILDVFTAPLFHSYWCFNVAYSNENRTREEEKLAVEFDKGGGGVSALIVGPCKADPKNDRYILYLWDKLTWPSRSENSVLLSSVHSPGKDQVLGFEQDNSNTIG
jgi:hypothetical protein